MKVEFSPRAKREINRRARWWRENRPAAPLLFDEELARALEHIRTTPALSSRYEAILSHEYRRVLMPETEHHVYFRVVSTELIRIVAVWSAVRGRAPQLR